MIGQRFGSLTVTKLHKRDSKNTFWECLCDCGSTTIAIQGQLKRGERVSCGCTRRRAAKIASRKERKTPTFISWQSMMLRCFNPNASDYHRYGGRGITVCPQWRESFSQFKADMGERPAGKTLDRKKTDGDYTPDNCKWSTQEEQQNNKRSNRHHEVFGGLLPPKEIMQTYNISSKKFYYWLKKGKTAQEIVNEQREAFKSTENR